MEAFELRRKDLDQLYCSYHGDYKQQQGESNPRIIPAEPKLKDCRSFLCLLDKESDVRKQHSQPTQHGHSSKHLPLYWLLCMLLRILRRSKIERLSHTTHDNCKIVHASGTKRQLEINLTKLLYGVSAFCPLAAIIWSTREISRRHLQTGLNKASLHHDEKKKNPKKRPPNTSVASECTLPHGATWETQSSLPWQDLDGRVKLAHLVSQPNSNCCTNKLIGRHSINKGHRASHSTVASLLGERGKQFAKLPVGREEPGNAQFRPGLFCLFWRWPLFGLEARAMAWTWTWSRGSTKA